MTRSRWPKRDSKSVQAALSAHSILSPVLAGLFYILFLTGILSVFSEELRIWETPELPVVTSLTSHGLGQNDRKGRYPYRSKDAHLFLAGSKTGR